MGADEGILEAFIDFEREISVIVARAPNGQFAAFDPVENRHVDHILDTTIAPALIAPDLARDAVDIAGRIAQSMDLVGLLAVEMFVTRGAEILVNEIAPRPHNSGHWTIDACVTSQFEQFVRAICGLPLGVAGTPLGRGDEKPDRRRHQGLAGTPLGCTSQGAPLRQDGDPVRPQNGSRNPALSQGLGTGPATAPGLHRTVIRCYWNSRAIRVTLGAYPAIALLAGNGGTPPPPANDSGAATGGARFVFTNPVPINVDDYLARAAPGRDGRPKRANRSTMLFGLRAERAMTSSIRRSRKDHVSA